MIWGRRAVVLGFVASITIARRSLVYTVLVAIAACDLSMTTDKREDQVVIDCTAQPGIVTRIVAILACDGKTGGAMIRGRRVVVVLHVTGGALDFSLRE